MTGRLAGATILVIDTHAETLARLGVLFDQEGAEVQTALRVDDGLAILRESEPDLLVVGLAPPVAEGLALIRSVRGDATLQRTPAIALAGPTMSVVAAEDAGFDRLLVKPVDDEQLVSEIARMLAVRRRAARA